MKKLERLFLACACVVAFNASADPLHEVKDKAYEHEDSRWLFPMEVAGFTRIGAAYTIDESRDASANYEKKVDGAPIKVLVDVYAADSANGAPTLEAALGGKRATETLAVDANLKLVVTRAVLTAADANGPGFLYFVDTGPWIVRIRATAPVPQASAEVDRFVREQKWDAFGLDASTCTGVACVR